MELRQGRVSSMAPTPFEVMLKLQTIYGYTHDLAVLLRRLEIAPYRHKAQQKAENFVKQFILGNSPAFSQ